MSWLFIPPEALPEPQTHACTACRCAPEPAGSTSGSQSQFPSIALFVTSSGKPMLRPPSWRGWKTRPWIRLLSGTTLPPLMAARGVERWILSAAATHAPRSAWPANARGSTIPAIYGHTSRGSSRNANPNGCFWKTSPIISTSAIARSEASWKTWATKLRKDCLRRQKSAHRINASGCLFWPTPNVSGGGNPPENLIRKGNYYVRPSGKKAHLGLDQAAKMWPTPRASANENRQTKPTPSQLAGKHGMNLATKAAMWPTPMASDGCKPSGGNRRSADLTHVAGMWSHHSQWPTPLARDWKGTNSPEHVKQQPPARNHMDQLANFAVYSRQALTISAGGASTSDRRRSLNPAFVEALMGWPVGWTGFDFVATAWSPWLQRMRSEFLRLGSATMDDGVEQ